MAATILTFWLLCALPAQAAEPEVELERMTWIAVRERIAAGATTAIIPTGGTEQNGAHMALGKHNLIVAETSRRIARALGDALVAPVIAYVPEGDIERKAGHMAYAGTLSVPDAVYMQLLEAAAGSLAAHGFKLIVLLGDSGGNQAPQRKVAETLTARWAARGVRVINAEGYYARNGGDALLLAEGETTKTIGTHAGIRDSSELMAVAPWAVDLGMARPDADGATGDARRATAARGERLLTLKVDAAVAEIRAARSTPPAKIEAGLLGRLLR
jgi:creatinine amidohydrolase/Fe(II)-dependent formamide hydrolase-like protein